MASKTKICPECKKNKNIDEFVNSMGVKAPRGRYCESCHKKRKEAQEIKYRLESLERWQAGEKDIIEKYKFLYEDDWKSRVPPSLVRLRLFMERDFCLYCGKSFKKHQQQPDSYEISENYHIDHMDPLKERGQDSIRNAVYVCKRCNLKKGDMPFVSWLKRLPPEYEKISREIYVEKHDHHPEDFKPGFMYGENWIASLDWDQLRKLKDEGNFD
jgi:CRISPR/Cas system Type II protein with McrA/HNH and RuvC-like nuclease domain